MMPSKFYGYTDKEIRYLNKQVNRVFRRTMKSDELNVIQTSKKMYEELDSIARDSFLRIARRKYRKATKKWMNVILTGYDPVTGYVFTHELERKRARFAEGTIARTEDGAARRLLALMLAQYALEITDAAQLQQYREDGVQKVRWVSQEDARRCKTCKERHGKIYDVDNVPPKPHIGCRCLLEPVE